MRRVFSRIGLWLLSLSTFAILSVSAWVFEQAFSTTTVGSAIERGEIMEAISLIYEQAKPVLDFLVGPFGLGFVAGATLVALPDIVRRIRGQLSGHQEVGEDGREHDVNNRIRPADETPFEKRLFVSQPFVNKMQMKAERILHVSFICFNGNKAKIVIQGSGGHISLEYGENARDLECRHLPAPAIPASIEVGRERDGLSDFVVAVDQRIDSDLAEGFEEIVEINENVYLNFSKFDIWVSPSDDANQKVRLPLPNKIRLFENDDRFFFSGRVVSASTRKAS